MCDFCFDKDWIKLCLGRKTNKCYNANNVKDKCENCGKIVNNKSMLRHIAQSERGCKDFYGARFEQMKKERQLKTWRKCSKEVYKNKNKLNKETKTKRGNFIWGFYFFIYTYLYTRKYPLRGYWLAPPGRRKRITLTRENTRAAEYSPVVTGYGYVRTDGRTDGQRDVAVEILF